MTLVSIITPSYNQAAYLEDTILSVLGQDYEPVEYLLVDGASTDGSVDIIKKYAGRLTWWVSEPDSGQAEAINKGFARATGDVVAWLNSDDLYLPGAIKHAVAALEANPELGMVFGNAITINPEGQTLNKLVFGDWGLDELMMFRIICQPAVFIRRACLENVGYLDSSYHYLLDHHLWLRIARQAPIQHVTATWAAARHHFGREALRILNWMENDPVLGSKVAANRRRIEGGAHRFNARYLLDGGLPGPALRAYGQALLKYPEFALQHWHRMLYALASLAGGRGLASWYHRLRQRPDIHQTGSARQAINSKTENSNTPNDIAE